MIVSEADKKIIAELIGSKFKKNIIEKQFSKVTKDKIIIKQYWKDNKNRYYVYPEYKFYDKHSFSTFDIRDGIIKKIDWYGECE